MAKKVKLLAVTSVQQNQKIIPPGGDVEVSKREAEWLISQGAARPEGRVVIEASGQMTADKFEEFVCSEEGRRMVLSYIEHNDDEELRADIRGILTDLTDPKGK